MRPTLKYCSMFILSIFFLLDSTAIAQTTNGTMRGRRQNERQGNGRQNGARQGSQNDAEDDAKNSET